jgi:hypothetical protein
MRVCDCGEAGMGNPCLPSCPYLGSNIIWLDEYVEMKKRLAEMIAAQMSGLIHPSQKSAPFCEVIDLDAYRERKNNESEE